MTRDCFEKLSVSLLLAVCFFLPAVGYGGPQRCCVVEELCGHLFYSFSHGNVWHLLGNLCCVWALRGRFSWCFDYLVAVFVSFLPTFSDLTVCGFSCVIFAEVGRRFSLLRSFSFCGRLLKMVKGLWLAFLIGAFVPNVAVFPHLWSSLAGLVAATPLQHRWTVGMTSGRIRWMDVKWEVLFLFLWFRKKVYGRL